jgi:hypothetical protein
MEKSDRFLKNRRLSVLTENCLEWTGDRRLKKGKVSTPFREDHPGICPKFGDQFVVDILHVASSMHRRALFFGKTIQAVEILRRDKNKDRVGLFTTLGKSFLDVRGILVDAFCEVKNCTTGLFAHRGFLAGSLHRIAQKRPERNVRESCLTCLSYLPILVHSIALAKVLIGPLGSRFTSASGTAPKT